MGESKVSLNTAEIVGHRNEINNAYDGTELVNTYFERRSSGRIYNPMEDESATDSLRNQIAQWQSENRVVVMSFGTFDAPFHPNHQRFLLDCKLQGVVKYYEEIAEQIGDTSWDQLDLTSKQEFTSAALKDGAVKLVVSTDGDTRVSASKGFNPNKGNSARPILGWPTRADNILGLSLQLDELSDQRLPIVDAITMHDQYDLPHTVHADPCDMVAHLRPDTWSLFYEAEKDIEAASRDARLKDVQVVVIGQGRGYNVLDPITGKGFSTTALVSRIKGDGSEYATS